MIYNKTILEVWSTDSSLENLVEISSTSIEQFLLKSKEHSEWMLQNLPSAEYSSKKDIIFNEYYNRNRFILGFSKILKIKKIEHTSGISDFIFDFSRDKKSFSFHSMNYLIKILQESNLNIYEELQNKKKSGYDLTNIVEESKVYLEKVFETALRKKPEQKEKQVNTKEISREELPPVEERQSDYEKNKQELELKEATAIQEGSIIDDFKLYSEDSPEEVQIPPDKIGLISDFYEEAYQSLSSMGKDLIDLENSPNSTEIVNTLFRSMHTVKGGSRLLKIGRMEALAHSLENLLDKLRNKSLAVSPDIIDILLDGKQILIEILEEVASKTPISTKINPILKNVNSVLQGKKINKNNPSEIVDVKIVSENKKEEPVNSASKEDVKESKEAVIKIKNKQSDSIRVSTEKLDEVINTASELSVTRILFQDEINYIHRLIRDIKKVLQRVQESDYSNILNRVATSNEQLIGELEEYFLNNKIKYDKDKLEIMVKKFYNELKSESDRSELTTSEEMTLLLIAATEHKNSTLKNVENLELLTTRLQSGVMNFRMIPLNSLFERFPTLVRDVARQIGKKVKLEISGGDTELDRAIINQLSDPMLHILRNSVDHGIETPEDRLSSGKQDTGKISLRSFYQGSNAIIEIKDDGRGINRDAVLKKALEKGLVSQEEVSSLSDKQIYEFIFAPGFSTAASVTELSGRGVGMDVVMSSIKELQGFVDIDSERGKGTTISLKIPLTLAIVRVLLFEVSGRFLALPMANISEILQISKKEIQSISNRLIYELGGEIIHLVYLSKVLDIASTSILADEVPLLILAEGSRKIGLIVDALHGRQEIVIKNLGNLLKKVPMIMGCAILSDRKLVLVLNPRDVMDACFEDNNKIHSSEITKSNKNIHNILVVDDSMVHRQNVRMILTRAGYNVDESENGFEALKMVRLKKYTILCVDVVMPLMDGIELTRRLRNLPLYRSIPILLITSKQSREDRERGIKSGANEYFEKPIDADVLLSAINRYITERETVSK